jgi:hypothetical protein
LTKDATSRNSRIKHIFVKKFISAAILLPQFFFAGCNLSTAPEAEEAPPTSPGASAATITASPNPVSVSVGEELGTTTITWNTGDGSAGQVFVSENGAPDRIFASGPSGSVAAPWIRAGTSFEFRLYVGTEHAKVLAKTQVTAHK